MSRGDGTTVLVVDDNRAMRMLVSRSLHRVEGVSAVLEADSAEGAIDVLAGQHVDLVLCDWNMGGMTGVELLEALRAAGWEVPFGFVTLESDEDLHRRALATGAAFVVVKPFNAAGLAGQVEAFLSGRGAAIAFGGDDASFEMGKAARLERLVGALVDARVTVTEVTAGPSRMVPRRVARYGVGAREDVAVLVVETELAGALAAALVQMSPAAFDEWGVTGALPAALEEGFHEVANVLARVVRPEAAGAVLCGLEELAAGSRLPELGWTNALWDHLSIEVAGYGAGLLSIASRPAQPGA